MLLKVILLHFIPESLLTAAAIACSCSRGCRRSKASLPTSTVAAHRHSSPTRLAAHCCRTCPCPWLRLPFSSCRRPPCCFWCTRRRARSPRCAEPRARFLRCAEPRASVPSAVLHSAFLALTRAHYHARLVQPVPGAGSPVDNMPSASTQRSAPPALLLSTPAARPLLSLSRFESQ
jgi:hypothetical protein